MSNVAGLFYQRDTRELITLSIDNAIAKFYEKTALIPNACHVHKLELKESDLEEAQKICNIYIIRSTAVPIGTIWIGFVDFGFPTLSPNEQEKIRGQGFEYLDF